MSGVGVNLGEELFDGRREAAGTCVEVGERRALRADVDMVGVGFSCENARRRRSWENFEVDGPETLEHFGAKNHHSANETNFHDDANANTRAPQT